MNFRERSAFALAFILLLVLTRDISAQPLGEQLKPAWSELRYRCIGPFRGGRSAAVTGVAGKPMLYYMGTAGGGVWKTEDGGSNWENISDGFFGGSIGAIAVASSDPNVIYVGGGECTVRGNVSHGYGVFKSMNGGQTWESVGLKDSRRIPRIVVHPRNANLVYAAVLGHLHGPSQQRGVFRSKDGGRSWEKVLFVSEEVGAFDLILNPDNPRVIYASTWRIRRTPYSLESGGEGSTLWKSTDGGDSWEDIGERSGLPKGTLGVIGVTVSPVDSRRVWAMVESREGGLFRSDDGAKTFRRVNQERKLRQRAWYYSRIYAGPTNVDEVYVLNVRMWHSKDGGENFSSITTPHVDHHDLWIDPADPQRMIVADDGGGQISFSQGRNWSTYMNQPTAQFYRVTTDSSFPYRVYGAQQDNSTVRIRSRSSGSSIGERDWEPTAGGESGHIAIDPTDNDIVYGGSYGGFLTRRNHKTGQTRIIDVWPDNPMGSGAGANKYRFQWNFPIFFSPHNPKRLYTAAQCLFVTENGGQNWTRISEDLTRNDLRKLGSSGGPITKDNTSVEYYCTIFAAVESPHEAGVLWTGSDDGLIHITRDGGKKWTNVTPPELPEWAQINSMEPHPTVKGGLYVAATRYKLDDFKPYLFKTIDYGKTWTQINHGIDAKHFTRVIRADPKRPGLLYAGTESGMYVSFDDGSTWQTFQLNLPTVPITDLAVKNDDLVVATQGRSFWILDDLTVLHQLDAALLQDDVTLLNPRKTYRTPGGQGRPSLQAGMNPQTGVNLAFYLKNLPDQQELVALSLHQVGKDGKVGKPIRTYSSKPEAKFKQSRLALKQGMNRVSWNMRHHAAETFPGLVLWGSNPSGPLAIPGKYEAQLKVGEQLLKVPFEIVKDPRVAASDEEFAAQFDFLLKLRDKLTETHRAISRIRATREQIQSLISRINKLTDDKEKYEPVVKSANALIKKMTAIEERLYQTKNQSRQDPLNYPIRLNNKLSMLANVVGRGDFRPTGQAIAVYGELTEKIDKELNSLAKILSQDLAALNELVHKLRVPAVVATPPSSS